MKTYSEKMSFTMIMPLIPSEARMSRLINLNLPCSSDIVYFATNRLAIETMPMQMNIIKVR